MPSRNRSQPTLAIALIVFCLIGSNRGEGKELAPSNLVHASLLADVETAVPGSAFNLGVRLKIAPHYHTYWINPGEFGNPTTIKLTGPAGFEFGEIQWPLPTRIEHEGTVTFGYEDDVLLIVPVKVGTSVPKQGAAKIIADVAWLSCYDTCVEGSAKLELTLPIGEASKPGNTELFENWKKRLPMSKSHPEAAETLLDVVQTNSPDGTPMPALTVHWKTPPTKVEWFPIATSAVAIENINVAHKGAETHISYKPTIYKPDQIPGGAIGSVVVYQDAKGVRHGITVPINLKKTNNAK